MDQLRKEHSRREGQTQGQEDQIRHFQRELESDLYSGTGVRHRDMLAKLKVKIHNIVLARRCLFYIGVNSFDLYVGVA